MSTTVARRRKTSLDVPDKLLTEIALGVDDPTTLAERYGFTEQDFATIQLMPSFVSNLKERQRELESKGVMFKVKARALADDLLEDLYVQAKRSGDFKDKLDAIKFLSAAGGVAQPDNTQQVGGGRQVSVSINLGAAANGQSLRVSLDFAQMFPESSPEDLVIDAEPDDE